jgi:hypothetical protein
MSINNYPEILAFLKKFFKQGEEFYTGDVCHVIKDHLDTFPVSVEDDKVITANWVNLKILVPLLKRGHIERTSKAGTSFKKKYYIMK